MPGRDRQEPREQNPFGTLLRRYRQAAGLSQEQLAERAGISTQAISALERGVRQAPYPDTVRLLAAALELSPDDQIHLAAAVPRGRGTAPTVRIEEHARVHVPVPPTPLVGRRQEVTTLVAILQQPTVRLLTLTGPGGVGKTRLALEVAHAAVAFSPDGVVFVDLAPVHDAGLVASAIAQVLAVRESSTQTLTASLIAHLRPQQLLLVLDNFEQVALAAPLLAELLAACPSLRLLVTSRTTLHLRSEQVYVVPPLAAPDPTQLLSLDELAAMPAVELLLQRAHASTPTFRLDATTAPSIAALCRQLDGLPLALELAAARLAVLSPQVLQERLAGRLALLSGGPHDLPARQQTLHATLNWSYDLLSASEQAVFRQMAVFVGGCTLEAAEAVCTVPEGTPDDVVTCLGTLVDHTLLRRVLRADGSLRFTMLVIVREYALERLAQRGATAATRARHAAYYLALAELAEPHLTGPLQAQWLMRLAEEQDDLRLALAWARGAPGTAPQWPGNLGVRLVGALWRFWYLRGDIWEGRGWVQALLAAADADERPLSGTTWAKVLFAAAAFAWIQDDYATATTIGERSLALQQAAGNRSGIADALQILALVAIERSDLARARQLTEEALALRRALGDTRGVSTLLHNLGVSARNQGEYAQAATWYEESLALHRQTGDRAYTAQTLSALGELALLQGQYAHAVVVLEESLHLSRAAGVMGGVIETLETLGTAVQRLGDLERAADLHAECLALARKGGEQKNVVLALVGLASVAQARGAGAHALSQYQEALRLAQQIDYPVGIAYSLEGVAGVAALLGHAEQGVQLVAAATTLRQALVAPLAPAERADQEQLLAETQSALGRERWTLAWAAGQSLPLADAIAVATHVETV